jgi:DNA polymerase I-like protein with 3'-5' exonuclease and polymerase domains
MALLDPVWYMMERGFKIDLDLKTQLSGEAHELWDSLQMQLNSVAGQAINVNSPKQMKIYLYEILGLPKRYERKKVTTNETALRNLLALAESKHKTSKTDAAKHKWLRAYLSVMLILKIRGIRKQISSYLDIPLDSDGRMRCTLSVGGTESFRFSSSKTLWDTGCNVQTIPRKLRKMFLADEGYEIAEWDLNRGESWVYAHLSDEPEMIRIHQAGEDFHAITACAISTAFGPPLRYADWPMFAAANENRAYRLRFLGKKTNHASAYQMGPGRFQSEVNKEADETGITITAAQAKQAMALWKIKYKYIEKWWRSIENSLNVDRTLISPYGRKFTFYDQWGKELFKSATAIIPQSTSVDYMNGGMLRVYNELVVPNRFGFELLHQNHDSIVAQYPIKHRREVHEVVPELLKSEVVINGYTISIPVEGGYGPSWGQLTEYEAA